VPRRSGAALIEWGASPNGGGNDDHGAPLNVASTFGESKLVDLLIKHGADVNQPDVMGLSRWQMPYFSIEPPW
jgi:ankyrin repeat protein